MRPRVVVEKIAAANVDRADAEAHWPAVDQIEVDDFGERLANRRRVIIAQGPRIAVRRQDWRRHSWNEKIRRAKKNDVHRSCFVDETMGDVAQLERGGRDTERRLADRLPETAQPLNAAFRRIACNNGGVDRSD